jgi:filamentous hemagglutinin family protein
MIHQRIASGLILFAYFAQLTLVPVVWANPAGPTVVGGQATVSGLGTSHVAITQASQQAIINWQQFNIAPNEVTQFIQPNVHAIALNRIFDQNPSQIFGSLQANGTVILLNPNGIIFGPNAQINVGGLIASSLNLSNANFLAGHYLFQGTGIEGMVKNMGAINASHDGVYLLAPNVENSGVITSPEGNIVLAAGAKAYLSNRPDGRGFLAELSNPLGQAVNLKDLIADGGHITLAGRVVNQAGLIQANSVREKNGKIELYASETLTLKTGSRTIAKGGSDGLSNGGNILAIADKLTGTAKFEKGATVDVSGGSTGGQAGSAELSGSRVGLGGRFLGTANRGFRSGRLLIDPTMDLDLTGFTTTGFSDISFATPRDALGNLLPDYDLRVTGSFDLNNVQPPPTGGTIRFDAGRDLVFHDLTLVNGSIGTPTKWDIVGVAERNILFTGFTGTTLQTAHGGSIDLWAKIGDVDLIDRSTGGNGTGALSTIRTQGGGGISIRAGRDLIASTAVDDPNNQQSLFGIRGISIDGPGRLNLDIGRDFIGGLADGVASGPGFVLWNSDTTGPLPQHTVNVGRNIGETNLTLGANGLPLTAAELRALGKPLEKESSARYADFALSNGNLTVTAGKNIYLARVRDAGLVGGPDSDGNPRASAFAAGLENNKATFVSRDGNIIINTNPVDAGRQGSLSEVLSALLPASFEARADKGSIQIRSSLKFLPSPTGTVKFFAHQDIQGVPKIRRGDDPNFIWLFVGYGGVSGGKWVAVDQRTIPQRPDLWPFLGNGPGGPTLPREAQSPPLEFPDYAKMDVDGNPPTVKLLEVNPNDLVGNTTLDRVAELVNNNRPAADNTTALAPVSFKAELGNISKLVLDLISRPFHKEVSIEAGNRIEQFNASIYLPDLGTQTQTVTEHIPLILDPVTNQPRAIRPNDIILIRAINPTTGQVVTRPWNGTEPVDPSNLVNVVFRDVPVTVTSPKVAATIKAQDIVLNSSPSGVGGIQFYGPGSASVIATHDLDLADGRGIQLDPRIDRPNERGGLLDIAVGSNLSMVTTSIVSKNGAGISIHGYDAAKPYVLGYDNSALYPLELPDSVRGGINLPAVGGKVNVGENSPRSQGNQGRPTGIQVVNGGSVGQMAKVPVVNNSDGTVTVNIVKDPAAILIKAVGDIDVNKSRIATFGGGDIRLTSTQGNINAGSGSKNERVLFRVETGEVNAQGEKVFKVYNVPGSGIFTFHPDDPQPWVDHLPIFNDPEINALLAEAGRRRALGQDVSQLEARANQLLAERRPIFERDVLIPFINSSKLGDITLTAEKGTHGIVPSDGTGRIIIPPAGILGRIVTLNGILDFQGGSITGRVIIPNNAAVIGTPNFPVLPPPSVGQSAPPLSGGGTVAAASSTAVASGTSAKSDDSEAESKTSGQNAQNKKVASKKDEKEGKSQLANSVRVKRGVVIQVDVKPAS